MYNEYEENPFKEQKEKKYNHTRYTKAFFSGCARTYTGTRKRVNRYSRSAINHFSTSDQMKTQLDKCSVDLL